MCKTSSSASLRRFDIIPLLILNVFIQLLFVVVFVIMQLG